MYKNIKQCGAQNKHKKKNHCYHFALSPSLSLTLSGHRTILLETYCLSSLGFTP